VDVYLLSLGDHLPDPVTGRRVTQARRLRSIVDAAVLAEQLGFAGAGIGEHHFHGYIVSAPELLLAAIAERTSRLRLATAVTLLAHANPVRVAEQLNTLDALSGGRAEISVARGVSPRAWNAFGSPDEDDVRGRLAENLGLLLRLLDDQEDGQEVSWAGSTRPPLRGVRIQPRPVQVPRPPIWVGGGFSLRSAELAAAHRLPLLLPSTLHEAGVHLPVVAYYREQMRVLERAGHTEAAVDLLGLAGLRPAGAIAELVNDDGTMQRTPKILRFARDHQLTTITIPDLIAYRQRHQPRREALTKTAPPASERD
jgi:alkanesulfonate monooxygenase SsuD/methylene tetrahydromethanopterin reductase-like flavin-dependent oxidoreductase (luciferase family)